MKDGIGDADDEDFAVSCKLRRLIEIPVLISIRGLGYQAQQECKG